MGEALISEQGALKHMGSAVGNGGYWRESCRLTLACYPKSEVATAKMRGQSCSWQRGWADTKENGKQTHPPPATSCPHLSRFSLNEVSCTLGHREVHVGWAYVEGDAPVCPPFSAYQRHEFLLMSPCGSAPMGDIACPEGMMQGLCLAAVSQSPPSPASLAPGSAGQKPRLKEGPLAKLPVCL